MVTIFICFLVLVHIEVASAVDSAAVLAISVHIDRLVRRVELILSNATNWSKTSLPYYIRYKFVFEA